MKKNRRPNNKISGHFSKRDFVCRCGHCNSAIKISLGLIGGLEMLRALSGNRVNIIQGYMCPDAAEKLGSLKRNYYTMGVAADITIDNVPVIDVFRMAHQVPEFRGIGLNLDKQCVHVDTRKAPDAVVWVEEHNHLVTVDDTNRHRYIPDPIPVPSADFFSDTSDE
ncbi:hypothetical protein EB093_05370 [bacterium]|nr:hypothetical protein [bacterium]